MKKPVNIIDGVCGMGKTYMCIQKIKEITKDKPNPLKEDDKVIYCTPYRDECFRMAGVEFIAKTETKPAHITTAKGGMPKYTNNKFLFEFASNTFNDQPADQEIQKLILQNKNITTTHSSLSRLSTETLNLLKEHNYHLIIDEAPTVINTAQFKPALSVLEFDTLVDKGIIAIDEGDQTVKWVMQEPHVLNRYADVMSELNSGEFIYQKRGKFNDVSFIWLMNKNVFLLPKSVTILTYLFEGSFCNCYFQMFGIGFNIIDKTKELMVYDSNIGKYDLLINLWEPRGMDQPIFNDTNSLSSSWYKKMAQSLRVGVSKSGKFKFNSDLLSDPKFSDFKLLSVKCNSFMRVKHFTYSKDYIQENEIISSKIESDGFPIDSKKFLDEVYRKELVSADEKLWTTYKNVSDLLLPNVGTSKGYSKKQFLVFNKKATNDYIHVKRMAYLVNVYPHVNITTYFADKGITLNPDDYAISEMIQWIFRSRLRNSECIELFVPSLRMRGLLKKWMNSIKQIRHDRLDEIIEHIEWEKRFYQ